MAKRRGNKEGSIYKRKDGRWCAQISVNGRRLTKYGKTQTEVREWLRETLAQIDKGLIVDKPQTLGEYLDSWLEAIKPSIRPRPHQTYEIHIRHHIMPELGGIKIQDLRPDHIQRFYTAKLDSGSGTSTVRLCHAVLHRALAHAVKWGLVARNVCDAVDKPKVDTPEMSVWDADQVRQFLQVIQGHRWEALFYLAVSTGLRQGELLGLMWTDVNWDTGKLAVQRQAYKGKLVELKSASSRRAVVLGPTALDKLRERQAHQEQERAWGSSWIERGLIFTSRTGKPIAPSSVCKVFASKIEEAGLPAIRFHDLRHTAATLMLQGGVHPKVVQEMLGHSSISMTLDTYSHVLPSLQEGVADRMEGLLQLQ
ncbi:MAG: site-specific integrase [Anaerolineales bacterium]|nr:MAG: site-specific integrase [Anaerolineales bacterium]